MIRDALTGRWTDQCYLRGEQYRDSGNLRARMGLHERFSVNTYGWFRWVFDQLDLPAGARILELGCGPGRLWLENAGRLGGDHSLALTDYSLGMAREARDVVATATTAMVVAASVDAQALPFADGSFDLVVANHMLYHVPDRQRAFAEVRRVLRPGGRFCAATNGIRSGQEFNALIAGVPLTEARPFTDLAFTLEDGAAQLAPHFAEVELRRYEDALVVTEAEPLLAYIRSMSALPETDDAQLAATVADLLERDGAIRITKDSGMFVAECKA
jgi:ubiquinone/menaquinone biosynthesis C-methylase UbiE